MLSTQRSPLDVVLSLFLIAAGAIVVGCILPGVVAYRAGVFAEDTMKVLVLNQFPDAKNAMATFERKQAELRAKMSRIDQLLDSPSTEIAKRPALIAERAVYDNQLQRAQPPISIQPWSQF
jgi:hypothetical protein